MSGTRELTPLEEVMESVTNRARALEAVVAAVDEVLADYKEHNACAISTLGKMQDLELARDAMKKL